jgi:channel protein (hemolysin III family)
MRGAEGSMREKGGGAITPKSGDWRTKIKLLSSMAGGLLYSFGVIFHAWQRLRFQNAIWHGFVLLGAACHYTAILDLVLT